MRNAVFFDIDGTLWDYSHDILESTRQAICTLRANGHVAFLCSGRTRSTIRARQLLDIGFDGILAGCGTYLECEGKVLSEYVIPYEKLLDLTRQFQESQLGVMYEGSNVLCVDRDYYKDDTYVMSFEKELGEQFIGLEELTPGHRVNKFCVDFAKSDAQRLVEILGEDYTTIFHTFGPVAEVIPAGYSKATAIRDICDHFGIDRSDTYAFGDSMNDLDMIRYAAHGVAMGNADPRLKEAADYVTKDLSDHGIYHALHYFSLI